MTEKNQNFEIEEGDDVQINTTVQNVDDGSNRNVDNHSAQVTLAEYGGGEVIEQYDESDDRFEFVDAANGEIKIEFNQDDTDGHGRRTLYYEIELTDPNGIDHTVTTGNITVNESY